jgi:hypothetical protein
MNETDAQRVLAVAQLRLLLLRAELGLRIGVGSVLRAAWLVQDLEGDSE